MWSKSVLKIMQFKLNPKHSHYVYLDPEPDPNLISA